LAAELTGHLVTTVAQAGLSRLKNGYLLARIAGNFDVFITADKNIPHQQNTSKFPFAIIVLRAISTKIKELKPLVPQILATLEKAQRGEVFVISNLPQQEASAAPL
jgi:hypothetical protein